MVGGMLDSDDAIWQAPVCVYLCLCASMCVSVRATEMESARV